jgi:hypothetical protein
MEPSGLKPRFSGSNFARAGLEALEFGRFHRFPTTNRAANWAGEENFSSPIL